MAFSQTASRARKAVVGASTAMKDVIGKGVAMPGGATKAAMGGAATKAGGFMGSLGGFGPFLTVLLLQMLTGSMMKGASERTMQGAQAESLGRMGEMMTPQAAMYNEIGPAVDTQLQMTMANLAQLLGPQNRLASGEEFIGGR